MQLQALEVAPPGAVGRPQDQSIAGRGQPPTQALHLGLTLDVHVGASSLLHMPLPLRHKEGVCLVGESDWKS